MSEIYLYFFLSSNILEWIRILEFLLTSSNISFFVVVRLCCPGKMSQGGFSFYSVLWKELVCDWKFVFFELSKIHSKIVVSAKEKKIHITAKELWNVWAECWNFSSSGQRVSPTRWLPVNSWQNKFRGSRAGETAGRSLWLEEREHGWERIRLGSGHNISDCWVIVNTLDLILRWEAIREFRTKESHCLIHLLTACTLLVCCISRGFLGQLGQKWVY